MKDTFKEYHKFTENEFENLWANCIFVFDTNTLLNMYRYSRKTVDTYFSLLNEIKDKKQLWLPYQVGYEFYENRINVISDYEKSYDEILLILEKAKNDIDIKYKDHPFLDLIAIKKEITISLSDVDKKIKVAKDKHPKWLEKDEVLEDINKIFKGNVGKNYSEDRLEEIKKLGKERYEKKIPPGFKDDKKPEDKKYGDLIIWYQIIDKAKESKKPIILISGDVKEDWWLEKDGKRLMPLPQLKKELLNEAHVDFHIYTADRFLELFKTKTKAKHIDESAIKEVRKIRESEEKKMMIKRQEIIDRQYDIVPTSAIHYMMTALNITENIMFKIREVGIKSREMSELEFLFHRILEIRNRITHGNIDKMLSMKIYRYTREVIYILEHIIDSGDIDSNLTSELKEMVNSLKEFITNMDRIFRYS